MNKSRRDRARPRTWRERASIIIAQVLAETAGQDEAAIRAALFDAYPFGERDYYPYKVWLDEIKRQRRLRPSRLSVKEEREDLEKAGQTTIFEVIG